jgi:hypothetical protein
MIMAIRGLHAAIWAIVAFNFADWKNWRKYYPTILFFGMGDLIYLSVFYNSKPLWKFEPGILNPAINELIVIFIIFSSTALLYLTYYPKKLSKQVLYILLWVGIYVVIEIMMTSLGLQKNYNGWNIWWSLLHNCYQFPLLAMHHKNPLLAWTAALAILFIMMSRFGVSLLNY